MGKTMLALLLTLLLTGCAFSAPAESGNSAKSNTPASVQTASAPAALPASPETLPIPTEDDVRAAYDRAVIAYGWFTLAPLTDTGDLIEVEGVPYRLVNGHGFRSMEQLRAYLNGIFVPEITEDLLATGGEIPMYRDVGGELHVTGPGRSRDPYKGAVQVEIKPISDVSFFVNVSVDLLDRDQTTVIGAECWSFPYELHGNRWLFSDFRLLY